MSKNTTHTTTTKRRRRISAEQQARIEQVKQDLLWAIEQTQREIRELEANIAAHQPSKAASGDE